jgi:hypothetical protein
MRKLPTCKSSSFLKKKATSPCGNQKTLSLGRPAAQMLRAHSKRYENKSFLLLFFKKEVLFFIGMIAS